MSLPSIERGGHYFRLCKPDWADCADTSFSKAAGGRWNPPGRFGALYLNATVTVAAAQARHQHLGRAIGLFDLRPERRPELATVDVPAVLVVDVVTAPAIKQLHLPPTYPLGVGWDHCRRIARHAYGTLAGVAARSAAEARPDGVVGEELAVFDTLPLAVAALVPFAKWYPDPQPNAPS